MHVLDWILHCVLLEEFTIHVVWEERISRWL